MPASQKGSPEEVRFKDFKDEELGKAAPYGISDQTANEGRGSVGQVIDYHQRKESFAMIAFGGRKVWEPIRG